MKILKVINQRLCLYQKYTNNQITFGIKNTHAENFLNYYIYHHQLDHTFDNKKNNFDEFSKFLKIHDIYSYLPKEKKL